MNRFFAVSVACGVFCASTLGAADISHRHPGEAGDLGVGVVLGSPTGLTMKYWLDQSNAFDASLAWKFGHDDRLAMSADYLWHITLSDVYSLPGKLPFYAGAGLRVLAGDDSEAGLRIPLGLAFLFHDAPIEIYGEIVPVVRFAPDIDSDLDGGVGFRYYFRPRI
jgi:hypothetical protein